MEDILREQIEALKEILEQKDQKIRYLQNMLDLSTGVAQNISKDKKPLSPYFSGDF